MNNKMPPKEALKRLLKGNERFVNDKLEHPDRTKDRREATAAQQYPFAIVLGCADSRIPVEIIFDQGIGDIFVVRVAGNVAGPLELNSIEFSVINNQSSIILVLGHENCGAIKAVLENKTAEFKVIANLIEPAIRHITWHPGQSTEKVVKANVRSMVAYLRSTPVISKYIHEGKVDIAGGYYNLGTGQVEILNDAL